MALKFLSKKRWHVRRLENIRKVAEAESKYREEQTRMAELRREREEERDLEALRKVQEASGRIEKSQPRLEWLYKTPIIKKKDEDEDPDKNEQKIIPQEAKLESKAEEECKRIGLPGTKWLAAEKKYKGDDDLTLREDPLTAIKAERTKARKEKEDRDALLQKLK